MGYLGKPEGRSFTPLPFFIIDVVINENTNTILNFCLKFDQHFNIKSYNKKFRRKCDTPNPRGPLTTRQPIETLVNVG